MIQWREAIKTMAQARVTEFFSTCKRSADSQPSKRRKVVILSSDVTTLPVQDVNVRSTRTSLRNKTVVEPIAEKVELVNTKVKEEPVSKTASRVKVVRKSKTQTAKTGRSAKTLVPTKNQNTIKDAFEKVSRPNSPTEEMVHSNDEAEGPSEEVTSAWDEHDGIPLTPSKRPKDDNESSDSEKLEISRKRTRKGKGKSAVEETSATPAKTDNTELTRKPKQSRKKLHLRPVIDSSSDEETVEVRSEETCPLTISLKTPPAISPIPETPETVRQQLKKGPTQPTSKKVKAAMALIRKLREEPVSAEKRDSKMTYKNDLQANVTSENMKQKLAKVGGLEDLKARLADMSKAKASLKKEVPKLEKFNEVDIDVPSSPAKEITKKAPAYERFHALATPAPPTLTMPYHYRLLGETFRSVDTVVSMLHNRNESCTFSKLKAAVQTMTKRNFEQKYTGQIKTVYPTAYTFRQQKGIPDFTSSKKSGYQLTVEANLVDDATVKQEKINFTAKHLLDRRCTFNNKLLHIVKRHHKDFLAKLDRPLTIPDDKITRWHPKFPVDEVPDVEVSELPKPPVTLMYQSAKDILEARRGQLPSKMEQALINVAQSSAVNAVKQENATSENKPATTNTAGVDNSQYKGIPQSLLDKIRAKESQKLSLAMTRKPEEDRRIQMLQRLPNLMRMLRSHFVTEKKPALPLPNVVQKLGDSSRNFIPLASMENHVKLMIEVLPQWLTLVEIKKGKYLKMDKNLDLQVLTQKVNDLLKNKS